MARRAKRKRNVGWFPLEPLRLASLGTPPNLGGELFPVVDWCHFRRTV